MSAYDPVEAAMGHVMNMAPDQLRTIMAHATGLHAGKTSASDTADVLARLARAVNPPPPLPTMEAIAAEVAARHGVSVAEMRGPRRLRPFVHARQEAMWRMRQVVRPDGSPRYSTTKISMFFGGRDHTTAMHGIAAHDQRRRVA